MNATDMNDIRAAQYQQHRHTTHARAQIKLLSLAQKNETN